VAPHLLTGQTLSLFIGRKARIARALSVSEDTRSIRRTVMKGHRPTVRRIIGGVLGLAAAGLLAALISAVDVVDARTGADSGCVPFDDTHSSIGKIRWEQQRHLASFTRFPDTIEVGARVWEDVWDWYVQVLRQTPTLVMTAEQRYGLPFRGTVIVLRKDVPPDYLGSGLDRQ
jgi:hypothetical protein